MLGSMRGNASGVGDARVLSSFQDLYAALRLWVSWATFLDQPAHREKLSIVSTKRSAACTFGLSHRTAPGSQLHNPGTG